MSGKDFLGGLLTGAIIGAALGLLLAPQSGEETREQIGEQAREIGAKIKDTGNSLLDGSRELYEQGKAQVSEAVKRGAQHVEQLRKGGEEAEA